MPGQDDENEVIDHDRSGIMIPITTDRPYGPPGNIGEDETFVTRKSRSSREILWRPLVCLTILMFLYVC